MLEVSSPSMMSRGEQAVRKAGGQALPVLLVAAFLCLGLSLDARAADDSGLSSVEVIGGDQADEDSDLGGIGIGDDLSLTDLLDLEISIGSVRARSSRLVPYDLTLITGKEIRDNHYYNAPMAFGEHGGFYATHINTAQDQISIRGSNAFQKGTIRLLINGNAHSFDVFNVTPWSTLPVIVGAASRIEVIKGNVPYYGRNAVNGALNLVMPKAVTREGFSTDFNFGSYNRSGLMTSYNGILDNGIHVVTAAQFQSVDSSFSFSSDHSKWKKDKPAWDDEHGREHGNADFLTGRKNANTYTGVSFYQSFYKDLGEGSEFQLYLGGAVQPNAALRLPDRICKTWTAGFQTFGGASVSLNADATGAYHEIKLYGSGNKVEFVRNSGTITGNGSGYFNSQNPNFGGGYSAAELDDDGGLVGIGEYDDYYGAGYRQPSYHRKELSLDVASVWSYGENDQSSVTVTPTIRWSQIEQDNFFGHSDLGVDNRDATYGDLNASQGDIPWFIEPGLVLQVAQEVTESLNATLDIRTDRARTVGETYGALLAFTFNASDDLSLRMTASQMQRPPEVEETDSALRMYLGKSSKRGEYLDNRNLRPETSTMVDLGATVQLGENVQAVASGFYSRRDDVIEFQYMGSVLDPLGAEIPRYRFRNANDLIVYGALLESTARVDALELRLAVTYQQIAEAKGRIRSWEEEANADDVDTALSVGRYGDDYLPPLQVYVAARYTLSDLTLKASVKHTAEHNWQWPGWKKGKRKFSSKNVPANNIVDLGVDYNPSGVPVRFYALARNIGGQVYNHWRQDKADNWVGTEVLAGFGMDL